MRSRQFNYRSTLIIIFLLLGLASILWRLIDLSVINRHFLLEQSDARILRTIDMPAHRGMVMDRVNSVLALSTPVYSVWIDPREFHPTAAQLRVLSRLLQMPVDTIRTRSRLHKGFVYLKRQNPPDVMAVIKKLDINGLHFQKEYQRFYPEGEVMAQVLGITNVDDRGQEGVELAYNQWLSGLVGKRQVLKDRLGNVISELALLKQPQEGRDLTLSIDHRIQYIAYRALKEQVQKYHAVMGSVVVLNPNTGEIIAMANQPSYNPNNRTLRMNADVRRNRALTDAYEPGSSMKPFTIAVALESGKYTPDSVVNTHPGYMRVGGFDIKDDFHDNGIINLQKILEVSSNIGAAKILLSLEPNSLWNLLKRFGFGEPSDSGFPGESGGKLIEHPVWYQSDIATLAYGYGISVTTLQLAQAYAVLANLGVRNPTTFLKMNKAPAGKRVLSEKVAREVNLMLENVVSAGTGRRAKVDGYSVAGKTGTAYLAGPGGYDKKKYISDFAGFAPAVHPQLVIAVLIREPQGKHFGAEVAAPVFSTVMAESLRILNVSPDKMTQERQNFS
ncbi:MAG: cell division protein [Gammaproteobacteria bacterium RIFCSPHIGHO2_12_FULL_42_13]|nr:MAG: cell division protein [Gammaproteobacteria bacterium RIFCSPHIGHO2_12_FULL_42_13]